MNDRPESDKNLPVPFEQATAIGRPGRTPPPQSWQTGEPEAVPWGQYLDAIRRRWWVVLLVTLAGSYAGRWYSRQIPAVYTTQAKIFLSPIGSGGANGPVMAPSVLTINSLRDIIKHVYVVAPVVRDLGLNVHYKHWEWQIFGGFSYDTVFTPGSYRLTVDSTGQGYTLTLNPESQSPEHEVGALGGSVGRKFGLQWQPSTAFLKPKQVVEFSVNDVIDEATALANRLRTGFPEEGGQIMTLQLEMNDQARIAPTLNAWAEEFIGYVTETKRTTHTATRRIIEQQLGQAAGQMETARRALQKFNEDNILTLNATTAPAGSILQQAAQLRVITRDLELIQSVLDGVARGGRVGDGRLYGSPEVMRASPKLQPELTKLLNAEQHLEAVRKDYAEGSDKVREARAAVRAVNDTTIPEILREIAANFAEAKKTLEEEVKTRSGELSQIPKRTLDGQTLALNYEQAVQLWKDLNETAQQARLTEEQTSPDLALMGPAIPPHGPMSSRGPRIFIMAVGASLAAGLALALLLDRLDRRFRYPQQATMELGLTIAGTIPYFKPNRKGELNLSASAQVVESFRTLRLATQFHFPVGEPVVVCISSPGPGEGKSLVASNLAVAFANAGQKTLLIDGDVRRGVVHTTFETERRPGLVDYLGGTATPLQIIRPTSTEHLFIVASGSRSRRAPELLTSDRMAALVAEMRTQYEVIIIDSAPFVAGMDAFALGVAAGTMLVVLRPGQTDRKLAENKLEIFDRLPITIIGAVLNAISSGRAYRYYSDYATYEGVEDNIDEADFDQGAPPPTSPTRLIGPRKA